MSKMISLRREPEAEMTPDRVILTVMGSGVAHSRFATAYGWLGYGLREVRSPADIRRIPAAGVLLQGGPDIQPELYSQELRYARGMVPERDSLEFQLLQRAHDTGMAVLGVCRGMQMLNAFYGGDLFQDLLLDQATNLSHWGVPHRLQSRTSLAKGKHWVNSWHHQGVQKVASGFRVGAVSDDLIVEMIDDGHLRLGVQWHPEADRGTLSEQIFLEHVRRIRQAVENDRRKFRK
jgi:gamma-glutamyl-gamma-aminobutyrate hydrolase PuuD